MRRCANCYVNRRAEIVRSFFANFFPKETPIKLLIEHAKILEDVSKVMPELVIKYLDWQDISELVTFIVNKENEADDIKMKLRKLLTQNVKIPFSKSELI